MGIHSGDLLSRVIGDIASLESFYVRVLAPPLVAILTAIATALFLSAYHIRLAVTQLLFMAGLGAGVPVLIYLAGRAPGTHLARIRAVLSSTMVEGIQGLADLLACSQEQRQARRVEALGRELGEVQLRLARVLALQNAAGILLSSLGMWAVLCLAIPMVTAGGIEGVFLPVIVLATLASFEAVLPMPLAAQSLEHHLEAARRLFAIVDAEPAVREPAIPEPVPERFGLEVKNLRFSYPASQGAYALDDISFSLPSGSRLAVVGPSGAGKSTLIHLLLRFWDYEEGEIHLEGMNLRNFATEDLRRRIAVVAQNTYLFAATVRENLLIARPQASEEDLIRAATAAQIHDFLKELPQGYDTWIGESGLRLSAGQRQRLALARALLKDAPLLILDEATANLDPLTEKEVIETLYAAVQGRTILAVTHRLVGLEAMDEILVLNGGKVVERGRHGELLYENGLYRRMWELQNRLIGE
jgi:thiol reductant ABC exporter CydC subunit